MIVALYINTWYMFKYGGKLNDSKQIRLTNFLSMKMIYSAFQIDKLLID